MSVPIATSPGRAGFDLRLSLDYDSGSGNGPFGLGWHLSTPAITRKTDKGLPRYHEGDEPDVFVLAGAEDLVPVGIAAEAAGAGIDLGRPSEANRFVRLADGSDALRATAQRSLKRIHYSEPINMAWLSDSQPIRCVEGRPGQRRPAGVRSS